MPKWGSTRQWCKRRIRVGLTLMNSVQDLYSTWWMTLTATWKSTSVSMKLPTGIEIILKINRKCSNKKNWACIMLSNSMLLRQTIERLISLLCFMMIKDCSPNCRKIFFKWKGIRKCKACRMDIGNDQNCGWRNGTYSENRNKVM